VEPKDSKIDLCVLLSKGKGVVGADVEQSNKEKVGSDVDESQYEMDEDSSDDSGKMSTLMIVKKKWLFV